MYHTRVRVKNFQVLAADLFSETRSALRSLYLWCISTSLVCPFSLKIICLLIHFLIFIYSKYVWKTGWRILYWELHVLPAKFRNKLLSFHYWIISINSKLERLCEIGLPINDGITDSRDLFNPFESRNLFT